MAAGAGVGADIGDEESWIGLRCVYRKKPKTDQSKQSIEAMAETGFPTTRSPSTGAQAVFVYDLDPQLFHS